MKISLNWLNDFVDLSDLEPQRIAELLSLHTAEVEGVEVYGEGILDVVVGEVLECGPHPDADKLSVTSVEYGADEPAQVVCGAPNVRKGLKVAFAPLGSCLPGDLKIKKAKLRGLESRGMICSEQELELSESHAGILELDADAPIGHRLVDWLGILDSVLELDNKSLTHRPDLWGHYGFARELSAILDRELKPLPVLDGWPRETSSFPIHVEDTASCPQYWGLLVELDTPPKPSSMLVQNRLLAVGQRPLNDVVDLTNYVLQEIGQPTHAFDLSRIQGPEIRVRRASDGEALTTLDGVNRKLSTEDVVIADEKNPVALAGVMGGESSEVHDETTEVLLESAVFEPVRVRRTSQRHALRSEASARFEKSLDPALAEQALLRFGFLLREFRPGSEIIHAPSCSGALSIPKISLPFELGKTATLLGLELQPEEVAQKFQAMGFGVQSSQPDWSVTVPSWRATKDVTTPIDLVEEVGRMVGYHKISPQPLEGPIVAPWQDPMRALTRRLSDRLAGAWNLFETEAYSFLHRDWLKYLGLEESDFVRLSNPVQDGVHLLRRDPIPSLLEQVCRNIREQGNGGIFEIAKSYSPDGSGDAIQKRWLAVCLWGDSPRMDGPTSLFGKAQAICADLIACTALATKQEKGGDELPSWIHPVKNQAWKSGQSLLGVSGLVDPRVLSAIGLDGCECSIVLLDLDTLLSIEKGRVSSFHSPGKMPAIKVDVALALPADVQFLEAESALKKAGGKLLESLSLFDLFEGGSIEEGWRSLGFRAVLRAADRTLSEKEEQKFLKKVEKVASELGGRLRT
ncbi:MAG: phenylalanine--tRNA ligase subunit beta [Planctomycetota bacterium]|jgi:phenylalanyl-tRNA synthetase beta chain|nr:phenylalanine--tRNA ligase subunit beta [Planctomycetota bacterium]|tara:strand:+ start:6235 stop:8637 length:2403 start_codon:yes stop_codon:yes gene_type:complete